MSEMLPLVPLCPTAHICQPVLQHSKFRLEPSVDPGRPLTEDQRIRDRKAACHQVTVQDQETTYEEEVSHQKLKTDPKRPENWSSHVTQWLTDIHEVSDSRPSPAQCFKDPAMP